MPLSVSIGDTSKETADGKLASMFVFISMRSMLRGISLQNNSKSVRHSLTLQDTGSLRFLVAAYSYLHEQQIVAELLRVHRSLPLTRILSHPHIRLSLPTCFFPSYFPNNFHLFPATHHAHLIHHDLIILIRFARDTNCEASHCVIF
jgi:hypothetical protein